MTPLRRAKSLSTNIHSARERTGYSRTELASEIGVSVGYISHIEKGNRRPSDNVLAKIAQVLDVPIEELHAHRVIDDALDALGSQGKEYEVVVRQFLEALTMADTSEPVAPGGLGVDIVTNDPRHRIVFEVKTTGRQSDPTLRLIRSKAAELTPKERQRVLGYIEGLVESRATTKIEDNGGARST